LAEVIKYGSWESVSMVANTFKSISQTGTRPIETVGDTLTLRGDEIEEFHLISPATDPDGMRVVGALGEMLFEQAKKTFGTKSMFVVAQNKDFNLIMFPRKNGFVVWKTNLSIEEALESLRSAKDG
jgi:hypothetical protein